MPYYIGHASRARRALLRSRRLERLRISPPSSGSRKISITFRLRRRGACRAARQGAAKSRTRGTPIGRLPRASRELRRPARISSVFALMLRASRFRDIHDAASHAASPDGRFYAGHGAMITALLRRRPTGAILRAGQPTQQARMPRLAMPQLFL